jgi:phosphomannomutase
MFICEDGEMFGEEYTLVACADYVLSKTQEIRFLICLRLDTLRDVTKLHNDYEAS